MSTSKETRVGAFVLAGLVVAGVVIFLIGNEKRLFDAKLTYHTSFSDVQGLKTGAPVRLGGIDIGTVSRIAHAENPSDNRLYVDLHVAKHEAVRVHQDTKAKISNKGLLGDKMIELEGGSPSSPQVPPDGSIGGVDPTDFTNVFSEVGAMTKRADQILTNLEVTSKALADTEMHDNLKGSVRSVNIILKQVAEGNGYMHRVLTDGAEADRLSHLVATLDRAASSIDGTVAEAQRAMARVNQGPGFVHEVLYGEKGSDAVANFGGAAAELSTTLRGIREGNGLAHSLLYGGDEQSQRVSQNIGAITSDLRLIMADLRAGKGTLGALLVDPSIYEDVKSVLGNVQRNDALRALVRYSIKQDEKRPSVRVSEQPAASSTPPR
ncbi:MAG TPA: MlaD family protein [Polyangiaceae bacterium]|nr:MlaD family protein [Polyangiaceae bacterium]